MYIEMLKRVNKNLRNLHRQCVMNEGLYLQVTTYFQNQVTFKYYSDTVVKNLK